MNTLHIIGVLIVLFAVSVCHGTFPVSEDCHGGNDNNNNDNSDNTVGVDEGPLSTTNFTHQEMLNDKYELSWNFNSTHIVFRAHVQTLGYVGLGISQTGRMFPSDLVLGWVKDGQSYFYDRHATSYSPALDDSQDWTLVSASEEGRYTTLVIMRPLDTCDDQDLPITTGPNHVIYSYRWRDPDTPEEIYYHGSHRRGSNSIVLLVGRE